MVGDREAQNFLAVIQDSFLKPLIKTPKREDRILDLLLTNREDIVSNIEIGDTLGNSDHKEVRLNVNWEKRLNSNNTLVPDFRKADFEGLRRHLHHNKELGLVTGQGLGEAGEVSSGEINSEGRYNNWIKKELQLGQQQFIVPYREVRSTGNYPRWMTDRLKNEIGMKRGLHVRIQRGETHLSRYKELARAVLKNTCKARRNYEVRIVRESKNNPKGFFQLYRIKVRDRIGPLKIEEGSMIDTAEEMSEALNRYFITVFTKERLDNVPDGEKLFRGEETAGLTDINISREDINRKIDRLKITKAPGPNEIFPRVLNECKAKISGQLTEAFRTSLDTGEMPASWRQAHVVPIYKKGDKSIIQNYRPISLTLVIGA